MRRMVLLLLTMFGSVAADAQPKPNVVFIMTDDVGYGDIGSYGAPDIRTPVLDRLARTACASPTSTAMAPPVADTRRSYYGPIPAALRHRGSAAPPIQVGAQGCPPRSFAAAVAQEGWLCHRAHRQVAPWPGEARRHASTATTISSASRAATSTTTSTTAATASSISANDNPAARGLHDRSHHAPCRRLHPHACRRSFLHVGALQRRALAVPGAG